MKHSVYLILTGLMICAALTGCGINTDKANNAPAESTQSEAAVDDVTKPDVADPDVADPDAVGSAEATNTTHQLTDASLADDNDDRGVMTASKGTNNRSNLLYDAKEGVNKATEAVRDTTRNAAYQVKKTANQARTAARTSGSRLPTLYDPAKAGATRTPLATGMPGDPVILSTTQSATKRLPVFKPATYNQMLRNASVHDSDGFLGDHENATTPGIRL